MLCRIENFITRHCALQKARIHFAGVECRNFSPRGPQTGETGDSMDGFAAWVTMRRAIQEACVVMECSDRFDGSLLDDALADIYAIQGLVLEATELGAPGHRSRFWAICLHKTEIVKVCCSLRNMWPLFRRTFTGGFKATHAATMTTRSYDKTGFTLTR